MPASVETLIAALSARSMLLVTAESCTAGGIASAITDVPGASAVFDSGYVTYSNAAKTRMLGVRAPLIATHGAVSEPVALAMLEGALRLSGAGAGMAVTGIAGPGGGSVEKPVGLIYIACGFPDGPRECRECFFHGDRAEIRARTVESAIAMLNAMLELHSEQAR